MNLWTSDVMSKEACEWLMWQFNVAYKGEVSYRRRMNAKTKKYMRMGIDVQKSQLGRCTVTWFHSQKLLFSSPEPKAHW